MRQQANGIDLATHYSDYLRDPKGKPDFLHYEIKKYSDKKVVSAAWVVIGTLVAAGSVPFFVVTAGQTDGPLAPGLAGGFGCIGAGAVIVIVSAVMYRRNKAVLERLRLSARSGALTVSF